MQFRTKIPLIKQKRNPIDYKSKILLFGSCFSENIGDNLKYFKFPTYINPFGILFHPKAIESSLLNTINKKEYTEDDLFFHNEQWHCFEAHSKLSNISKDDLLQALHTTIKSTYQQLVESSHIIITLGTAWVYRFIETDTIVANCHKIPQKKFLKELLTVDEITESLNAMIALIHSINKNVSILFTLSPVRHLKDGFIENQQSKSHLTAAIHNVLDKRKNVSYFPSYEIMIDELRDYRFYDEDMIHPNTMAIKYIWEKFVNTLISDDSIEVMEEVDAIRKNLAHKPFNSSSKQHQEFLANTASKIKALQLKFPAIHF